MSQDERPQGPGLKWKKRRRGVSVPYWYASATAEGKAALERGYPVKSANLGKLPVSEIGPRCERLQTEVRHWLGNTPRIKPAFDGTFGSLMTIYETDSESTFHALKPGVQQSYRVYIPRLRSQLAEVRIDDCDGTDLKRWFREWRVGDDGKDRLPRACFVLAVLKAALAFGGMRRLKGVGDFKVAIEDLEFPRPKRRTYAPDAAQVIAAREAAHAAGAPERALVYSLIFETTGREFDFIGTWLPMWAPQKSTIHDGNKKWIGPLWSAINENGILRFTPTKTEDSTGVEVIFDLSACPMVQEDLARIKDRSGPLIVNPATRLPYRYPSFNEGWHADFKAAEIPKGVWCRDLRAGGVTEGDQSGASRDDRRKLAGHAKEETTMVYERDMLAAHRRTMAARTSHRKNSA